MTKSKSKSKPKRLSKRQRGLSPTQATVSRRPPQDMEEAVKRVKGGEGLREISREYKIPASTLSNKLNFKHQGQPGQPPRLSLEFEKLFVSALEFVSTLGFGLQFLEIRTIVQQYLPSVSTSRFGEKKLVQNYSESATLTNFLCEWQAD